MDIALFILMALIHKSIQEFINLLFQSYYPIIEHAQFILCSYNTDHFTLFVWVISSSSSSSCNLFSALILRQCSDSGALLQAYAETIPHSEEETFQTQLPIVNSLQYC